MAMETTGDLVIAGAAVALPDRVIPDGWVRCRDGRIDAIGEGLAGRPEPGEVRVDADGAVLIPGVIDLHNDALEFEVHPRSSVDLPLPFAIATMERRLAAAGVTTEFHAVVFMNEVRKGRTVADAVAAAHALAELDGVPGRAVRHQILHRLDVRTPGALAAALPTIRRVSVPYVSLNDHPPGQGQYRDVARLLAQAEANAVSGTGRMSDPDTYRQRMQAALADANTVPTFYREVVGVSAELPLVIATHDDDTVAKVDEQLAIGASVAEFPITIEAARHARAHRMTVVVGAPNIVRGGSQSGNLAAHDLVRAGLADAICADYHAPSLIPAAFRLVEDGLIDLPAAIRMLTLAPAQAVGLSDRGAIAPGLLADLALVRLDAAGWPHVERTWVGGRPTFAFARQSDAGLTHTGSVAARTRAAVATPGSDPR